MSATLSQHASLPSGRANAGIEEALSDPEAPLTLFAPTNSAWLTAVKQFPMLRFDQAALRAVLLQHIIVGKKAAADFPSVLVGCCRLGRHAFRPVGQAG